MRFMPVAPRILYCVPGRLFFQHIDRLALTTERSSGVSCSGGPEGLYSTLGDSRVLRVAYFPAGDGLRLRRAAVPGDGKAIVVAQDIEHEVFPSGAALLFAERWFRVGDSPFPGFTQ